jgi:hypothetical protein
MDDPISNLFITTLSSLNGLQSDIITVMAAGISIIVLILGYQFIKKTMLSTISNDDNDPEKGSPDYYKERNEYRHSKKDSFSRWDRHNKDY